ncbi:probable 3-beta-hydroxysteroid-Delta(8),Delta(7)-isomerase [Asparagus officinalis]|uniref:probable 3-beta-hydroxysteroid-Delta(8),Delta(7)-isomerase n=1 Tax=Asparagus officinalis TaxID=4686 RepID=UPI00098E3E19|nr:probable 3-beta-hydroxysteroid-Delta(8),Delta(7)-isomerase [Asparagus officinalis]
MYIENRRRDAAVVAVEGITAAIEGPACLLAVYAIATRKPYSYTLQLAISLGQLYGCLVYFITAFLLGDNFSTSPYYYWAYYIGANSSWVVIPSLIAMRSWKKISAAVNSERKMKSS